MALVLLVIPANARDTGYGSDTVIGIDEKLGQTLPLAEMLFEDESGREVALADLVKRPTILTLVYFRCPSICHPLLQELAKTVDQVDLVPGVDYDLVTVSFDVDETPELARLIKKNLLGGMRKKVPPEAWHFLTGDEGNILRLTQAIGFRFRRDGQDFEHAATVVFLSKEGKIVRYLGGLQLLPADLKLAVLDAAEGRPRTLMQRIQQLCYRYDEDRQGYVLQLNMIVLFTTLAILVGLFLFLMIRRRGRTDAQPAAPGKDE